MQFADFPPDWVKRTGRTFRLSFPSDRKRRRNCRNWSWLTSVKSATRPADFSSRREWDRRRPAPNSFASRFALRRAADLPISIYIAGENLVYRYRMDNAIVGLYCATANNNGIYLTEVPRVPGGVRRGRSWIFHRDCITPTLRDDTWAVWESARRLINICTIT